MISLKPTRDVGVPRWCHDALVSLLIASCGAVDVQAVTSIRMGTEGEIVVVTMNALSPPRHYVVLGCHVTNAQFVHDHVWPFPHTEWRPPRESMAYWVYISRETRSRDRTAEKTVDHVAVGHGLRQRCHCMHHVPCLFAICCPPIRPSQLFVNLPTSNTVKGRHELLLRVILSRERLVRFTRIYSRKYFAKYFKIAGSKLNECIRAVRRGRLYWTFFECWVTSLSYSAIMFASTSNEIQRLIMT